MSTARIRPFAVARILTMPPPAAPSTSILSRLSCAFCSSAWAFWAICMIDSKSGISGISAASHGVGFKLGVGERIHDCADVRIRKDIGANALLGHFLLIEERRIALIIGERHFPAGAGQRFKRRRQ